MLGGVRNREGTGIFRLYWGPWGKILNVERARLDKILKNAEIRNMIVAFGTGVGDDSISVKGGIIRW